MILRPSRAVAPVLLAAFFVLSPALAVPAHALEVTVFLSDARPSVWGTGVGATLTTTWLKLLCLEAELARQPGLPIDSSMTSFGATALLAPPIGPLTPFGGLGVGLFRQSRGSLTDNGTLKAFVLGAKLKIAGLVVIRAEYRAIDLSGEPPLGMDKRFSGGIGISF
jgi:hypothetical protein